MKNAAWVFVGFLLFFLHVFVLAWSIHPTTALTDLSCCFGIYKEEQAVYLQEDFCSSAAFVLCFFTSWVRLTWGQLKLSVTALTYNQQENGNPASGLAWVLAPACRHVRLSAGTYSSAVSGDVCVCQIKPRQVSRGADPLVSFGKRLGFYGAFRLEAML